MAIFWPIITSKKFPHHFIFYLSKFVIILPHQKYAGANVTAVFVNITFSEEKKTLIKKIVKCRQNDIIWITRCNQSAIFRATHSFPITMTKKCTCNIQLNDSSF